MMQIFETKLKINLLNNKFINNKVKFSKKKLFEINLNY